MNNRENISDGKKSAEEGKRRGMKRMKNRIGFIFVLCYGFYPQWPLLSQLSFVRFNLTTPRTYPTPLFFHRCAFHIFGRQGALWAGNQGYWFQFHDIKSIYNYFWAFTPFCPKIKFINYWSQSKFLIFLFTYFDTFYGHETGNKRSWNIKFQSQNRAKETTMHFSLQTILGISFISVSFQTQSLSLDTNHRW